MRVLQCALVLLCTSVLYVACAACLLVSCLDRRRLACKQRCCCCDFIKLSPCSSPWHVTANDMRGTPHTRECARYHAWLAAARESNQSALWPVLSWLDVLVWDVALLRRASCQSGSPPCCRWRRCIEPQVWRPFVASCSTHDTVE
jgi:hypothetical protein